MTCVNIQRDKKLTRRANRPREKPGKVSLATQTIRWEEEITFRSIA